jgi:hypothetical protein
VRTHHGGSAPPRALVPLTWLPGWSSDVR